MKTIRRIAAGMGAALLLISAIGTAPRRAVPLTKVREKVTSQYESGHSPAQVRRAYGLDGLAATGAGQTIAIVSAYGSPTIENDLAVFSRQFGLPPAKLTIAYPQGEPKKANPAWALETAMDVQWAHAMAPGAEILLVVAKSDAIPDLAGAISYAGAQGPAVVSNSWGTAESAGDEAYSGHFRRAGTVFVAASGDSGNGVNWPASSPDVVAVGGTTLNLDGAGNRTGAETAWSGSGGGVSAYQPQPAYQASLAIASGGKRVVPDVAAVADPATGVAVYTSTRYKNVKGWFVAGGTSLAAPLWAGFIALANEGRSAPLTGGHAALYGLAAGAAYSANYHDITEGSNGACGPVCTAGAGYDAVTGLGAPAAGGLVPGLAR